MEYRKNSLEEKKFILPKIDASTPLYNSLSPGEKSLADAELEKIKQTGQSSIGGANFKKNFNVINFLTTRLASLYVGEKLSYQEAFRKVSQQNREWGAFYRLHYGQGKKLSEIAQMFNFKDATEVRDKLKNPIKQFLETASQNKYKAGLFSILNPFINGQPTTFYFVLKKYVGPIYTPNKENRHDFILDGFYAGLDRALENFSSTKGTFLNLLITAVQHSVYNLLNQQKDGYKVAQNSISIDNDVNKDIPGKSGDKNAPQASSHVHKSIGRALKSNDDTIEKIDAELDKGKTQTDKLYNAVIEWISKMLNAGKSSNAADVFNLLFVKQVTPEVAAKQLGLSRGAIDKKVYDIKKLINMKMEEFKEYLRKNTGQNVSFPNNVFNPQIAALREINEILNNLIMESNHNKTRIFIRKMLRESMVFARVRESDLDSNMMDEEMMDEERITNPDSKQFVARRENFIGSHIYGEDLGGLGLMYVAYSYGEQYPAYLWYKNKWYHNTDNYILDDGSINEFTKQHMEDMRPTHETHGISGRWMQGMIRKFMAKHKIEKIDHTSVQPGEKN